MNTAHENIRTQLNGQIEAFLSRGGAIVAVPIGTSGISGQQKRRWSKETLKKPADHSAEH